MTNPISNTTLQKIYDEAKTIWLERHNVEYEPHLWNTLCIIHAYNAIMNLTPVIEIHRDFYGPDDHAEFMQTNPDEVDNVEPKK